MIRTINDNGRLKIERIRKEEDKMGDQEASGRVDGPETGSDSGSVAQ